MCKLRSIRTKVQYLEIKIRGNLLSALRWSLEEINMAPNSPTQKGRKIMHARYAQDSCGCDFHTNDSQDRDKTHTENRK